jgi:hypothetical protein
LSCLSYSHKHTFSLPMFMFVCLLRWWVPPPLFSHLIVFAGQAIQAVAELSALFTAPLLREAETWTNQDLTLYVDDGAIYTSGATYKAASDNLTTACSAVLTWLDRHGLRSMLTSTKLRSSGRKSPHLGSPTVITHFSSPGSNTKSATRQRSPLSRHLLHPQPRRSR